MEGRLTNIHNSYAEMVLHKRMQKSVRWQATEIPPEIPSLLRPTCIEMFNRHKPYTFFRFHQNGNTRSFYACFIANVIVINYVCN
uniref:Uncharacterized protein n=1 Tax=Lactuca sativa TaxID=4236 RepID=A0A9R1UKF3_LACSA|nr:hypothetical protein LSAT_V11C900494610 [Lactuca sativa]